MRLLGGGGRDEAVVVGRESLEATSTIILHEHSKWPLIKPRLQC